MHRGLMASRRLSLNYGTASIPDRAAPSRSLYWKIVPFCRRVSRAGCRSAITDVLGFRTISTAQFRQRLESISLIRFCTGFPRGPPQSTLQEIFVLSRVTGWVRIQLPDVLKTRLISILMGAKMQLLEVVTGHSQFLSHFSVPQAMPTQPVTERRRPVAMARMTVPHGED